VVTGRATAWFRRPSLSLHREFDIRRNDVETAQKSDIYNNSAIVAKSKFNMIALPKSHTKSNIGR
jgi:hypothetical protein